MSPRTLDDDLIVGVYFVVFISHIVILQTILTPCLRWGLDMCTISQAAFQITISHGGYRESTDGRNS